MTLILWIHKHPAVPEAAEDETEAGEAGTDLRLLPFLNFGSTSRTVAASERVGFVVVGCGGDDCCCAAVVAVVAAVAAEEEAEAGAVVVGEDGVEDNIVVVAGEVGTTAELASAAEAAEPPEEHKAEGIPP